MSEGREIDRAIEQREAVPAENVDQSTANNAANFPWAKRLAQKALNLADAQHVGSITRTEEHFRGEPLQVGQVLEVSLIDQSVNIENFAEGFARIHSLKWALKNGTILFTITDKSSLIDLWHHLTDMEQNEKIHSDLVAGNPENKAA